MGIKPSVNSTFNGFPLHVEMPTSRDLKSELSTLHAPPPPPAPSNVNAPTFPHKSTQSLNGLRHYMKSYMTNISSKFALINDEIIFVGE